jgi:hypothetical protein
MFGYVRPFKPDLLVRELSRYQAVYCGICKQISQDYGQLPRLFVGYDLTLLAVLLLALGEDQPAEQLENCLTNPLRKRPVLRGSPVLEHAAALTVLMAYNKLKDDARDEHPVLGRAASLALTRAYRRARARFPAYEQILQVQLARLQALEKESPDFAAADIFGDLLGEVIQVAAPLATDAPAIREGLALFGKQLGAWIYLLDAIDDREGVCNNGSWNPFSNLDPKAAGTLAEAMLIAHEEAMDRIAALLPYTRDAGLLGNIVTAGLPATRAAVMAGQRLARI